MNLLVGLRHAGVAPALLSALLFGASTPVAKQLVGTLNPWMLAGLLYLGSGLGLAIWRRIWRFAPVQLPKKDWFWFGAAILAGGVVAPVLLLIGLTRMSASDASLLLNAEAVLTALLAWVVFRENVTGRILLGFFAIVAGAVVLSWPGEARFAGVGPLVAVLGACLAWAIDNNLTRRVALNDATWIACVKGLSAGTVNLSIALWVGSPAPSAFVVAVSLGLGLVAYGVSLALFVVALRHLGTARAGAYFSVAPFFGAAIAVVAFGEPVTTALALAGVLMAFGAWLHLTERHAHLHQHTALEHTHEHVHDDHHDHHAHPEAAQLTHTHLHRHTPMTHSHHHFPDEHHRHSH